MNFGVWLPNCRHLATPDVIRGTAVRAEQLGYDSVWVSDHVVTPNANVKNFGETIFDPLVTLAVVAGATGQVRLGTTVLIVPYRNPVVTAKMISSLDALSGGRVVLGIGAGWLPAESAMLGVPFKERGAMTDEYLEAMRELWTSRAPSFAGKYTQFSDLVFEPKPLQQPHPPIWVGGHSPAALRRASRFGAAWHPINRPPAELSAGRAELARLCEESGRAAAPALTLRNDVRILRPGESAPASTHGGRVLAGEPAALVGQIAELADCGVEHLVLEFLAADGRELEEQMVTFAERVRPALDRRS
ncbi:MAG: LLM class F420-dependent oxidoreductase [Candidatus Rokubacteria bacterium]|nr:LLM class F420-dependent oxidoreductase [Candidatus Rokubacteria bacterium]